MKNADTQKLLLYISCTDGSLARLEIEVRRTPRNLTLPGAVRWLPLPVFLMAELYQVNANKHNQVNQWTK